MVSLANINRRFEIAASVIAGGQGIVRGVITETDQNQTPSYIFVNPRHVFRTRTPTALRPGMVIRTPSNSIYIVGDNGPSETGDGVLWESFRLFEVTGQAAWTRRSKVLDPVAKVERDGDPVDLGMIWIAIEPLDREPYDRKLHINIDQARFISAAAVLVDDLIDGRPVTRCDSELGLFIGTVN